MSDLVYRQAAIAAIKTWGLLDGLSEGQAIEILADEEKLPSVPPQKVCVAEVKVEIDDIKDYIDKAINAERWIPCGERLPEDFEEVNVTWINTDPEPYYDFAKGKPFTGTAVFYKGRWFWYSAVCTDYLREYGFSPNDLMDDSIKVVAWQPIPEPWKGEDDERA